MYSSNHENLSYCPFKNYLLPTAYTFFQSPVTSTALNHCFARFSEHNCYFLLKVPLPTRSPHSTKLHTPDALLWVDCPNWGESPSISAQLEHLIEPYFAFVQKSLRSSFWHQNWLEESAYVACLLSGSASKFPESPFSDLTVSFVFSWDQSLDHTICFYWHHRVVLHCPKPIACLPVRPSLGTDVKAGAFLISVSKVNKEARTLFNEE